MKQDRAIPDGEGPGGGGAARRPSALGRSRGGGQAVRHRGDADDGGADRPGRSERSDRPAVRARYSPSLSVTPEERADPIGDLAHSPVEGIVHRYPDRVLLKAVHVCPVYCRFCFRREMVGPEGLGTLSPEAMDAAIGYIAAHSEIWEVILTGGDPLVLSARRLEEMMARLAAIPHVKIVRFHSPRAGGGAGAGRRQADRGAQGERQDHLCGGARQPSARADGGGAGGDRRGWSMRVS